MKYVGHSATSLAAAASVAHDTNRLRMVVYDLLSQYPRTGRTDPEMQDELGMPGSTQRPRRVELCERGLVHDSGMRRPTPTGRMAVVWVVVRK